MSVARKIEDLVSNYILGSIKVQELADRFEEFCKSAESEPEAANLAHGVEARIARYFEGFIPEESLRLELNDIVPKLKIMAVEAPYIVWIAKDFEGSKKLFVGNLGSLISASGSISKSLPAVEQEKHCGMEPLPA
jgi:hypothetical protein